MDLWKLRTRLLINSNVEMWYNRNPQHDTNLDSGEDMFWGTAEMVAVEYAEYIVQQRLCGSSGVEPLPPKSIKD
jgi:hypothetical protein